MSETQNRQLVLDEVVVNKILAYLSDRPAKEVIGLINELQENVKVLVPGPIEPKEETDANQN